MPAKTSGSETPTRPKLQALQRVERRASDVATQAIEHFSIESDEDQRSAGEFLTTVINPMLKELDETFGPIIERQKAALKEARDQDKKHRNPLDAAKLKIRKALEAYEMKKREARRRLEEKIRARQVEEARSRATDDAGDFDPLAGAVTSGPSELSVEPEKVEGVSYAEVWDFELVDAEALRAEFRLPDEKAVRKLVKAMGERAVGAVSADARRPAIRVYRKMESRTRAR